MAGVKNHKDNLIHTDNLIKVFRLAYEYYQKNNLSNCNIKFIVPLTICQFDTEEEFQKIKQLFNDLSDHLKQKIDLYNDFEKFIIEAISNSKNFDEYCKITKNNTLVMNKIRVYCARKSFAKKSPV